MQWFIVRINLKTVCQDSFKDCQYYFKGSILKNPDIFKKILTHFKKILTLFKKILNPNPNQEFSAKNTEKNEVELEPEHCL